MGPLYAVCYLSGGWEPGWAGLQALRNKTLDVDLLMIVAAIGAAAIGQVLDGALLIVIFATSGALEAWATARTEESVRGLLEVTPDEVDRLRADGCEEVVAAASLEVGDVIAVRPGEAIGADGVVIDGASEVDQASVTGEPLPADKTVDDEVFAGTINGTGILRVRVTRQAHESVVARLAALVEQAARTKARTQLFIEKVEQRYSIGVVAATLVLFAAPQLIWGEDLTTALLRAMTFMIMASPCAVVLATMPAHAASRCRRPRRLHRAGRAAVTLSSGRSPERTSVIPTRAAMACAVRSLSPVSRMGVLPVWAVSSLTASAAWGRSSSLIASTPTAVSSTATTTAVSPAVSISSTHAATSGECS